MALRHLETIVAPSRISIIESYRQRQLGDAH